MAMRSGVTVTDVFTVGVEDAGDDSSQSAEVDAVSLSVLSSAVAAQNKKSSSETVCCVLCAVCAVCAAGPGRAERGQERGHCSETGLAPHTPTSHTYRRHNSAEDRGITEIKIVSFSRKLHLASCQIFSMSVSNPGGRDCLVKH